MTAVRSLEPLDWKKAILKIAPTFISREAYLLATAAGLDTLFLPKAAMRSKIICSKSV